jgi:hypothetical protein
MDLQNNGLSFPRKISNSREESEYIVQNKGFKCWPAWEECAFEDRILLSLYSFIVFRSIDF